MCSHNWKYSHSFYIRSLQYDVYKCTECGESKEESRPDLLDYQE